MKLQTTFRTRLIGSIGLLGLFCIASGLASTPQVASAQQRGGAAREAQPAAELVTRVYPVADLVFSAPDYPASSVDRPMSRGGVIGGMGGGTFGMGGGTFALGGEAQPSGPAAGAAVPTRKPTPAAAFTFTIDHLITAIVQSIQPEAWEDSGGPGTIVALGGQLVISQSPPVHAQIEELLTALRKQGARQTVTIRAYWLSLTGEQYGQLIADMPASSPPLVNRERLEALARDAKADMGEITCFDGQTVHITSGRNRSGVTSVVPVVGQLEAPSPIELAFADGSAGNVPATDALPMLVAMREDRQSTEVAQFGGQATYGGKSAFAGQDGSNVGYQPTITVHHAGATLEVTPTRLPSENGIVLDLRSVVSRWNELPDAKIDFRGVVQLDRTDVVTQQLATTIKVPTGKPVLAGGLTLEPGTKDGQKDATRLYLVVEAIDATASP